MFLELWQHQFKGKAIKTLKTLESTGKKQADNNGVSHYRQKKTHPEKIHYDVNHDKKQR